MKSPLRFYAFPLIVLALAGCATQGKPPPVIPLDEPVEAQFIPEPPTPVEVVALPEPLALPAQLKPLPDGEDAEPAPEPADETVRVSKANTEARVAPRARAMSMRFRCGPSPMARCTRSMPRRDA